MHRIFHYLSIFLFSLLIRTAAAQNFVKSRNEPKQYKTKIIKLKYIPREVLSAQARKEFWSVPLNIQNVKDSHAENLAIIGESKSKDYIFSIYATSVTSVGSFATKVLKKCYTDWGGKTGSDTYILEPEILEFFVSEENLYFTRFKIKFTLKDKLENKLWSKIIQGDAKVFGMHSSEDNYNEGFSDVLQEAFVKLFEDDDFISSCLGKNPVLVKPTESIDIDKLRDQLLLLIKECFDEQSQIAYVKQRPLALPLSANQMIEWKKAGIPQAVITEVIKQGSVDK